MKIFKNLFMSNTLAQLNYNIFFSFQDQKMSSGTHIRSIPVFPDIFLPLGTKWEILPIAYLSFNDR